LNTKTNIFDIFILHNCIKLNIFQSDNLINTTTPEKKNTNKENVSVQGEKTKSPSIPFRGKISDNSGFIYQLMGTLAM